MHTEHAVVDHDGEGGKVEHVDYIGPDLRGTVVVDAFHVEALPFYAKFLDLRGQKGRTGTAHLGNCS